MRILHLDDDPAAGAALIRMVGDAVAHVTGATRVDQAIALLRSREWDVVVADSAMPGMGGVELMREVRRLVPSARCIVFTERPDDDRIQIARLAGVVDEVVAKTANPGVLRQALGLPEAIKPKVPMRLTPAGGVGRDIRDFAELLVADLELELFDTLVDGRLPDAAQDKIRYFLSRAWDAGFAAASRAQR